MANRQSSAPIENETRLASNQPPYNGVFMVQCPTGKVSVLALQDTAGDTHYLWFDTTGDLRCGTTEPTAPNSDGTVVGTQS